MTEGTQVTPIDRLRSISPEGARTFMEHRKAIMDNPQLQALPAKYKLLVGIGVAAALQSSTCTLMWTRLAKQAGATEAELAETTIVAVAMAAGAAWSHGGLALQCSEAHAKPGD